MTRSSSKPSEAPSGKGKPTGALAGVHPVDSISRDVRPAPGTDLTASYPQLRRYATRTTL